MDGGVRGQGEGRVGLPGGRGHLQGGNGAEAELQKFLKVGSCSALSLACKRQNICFPLSASPQKNGRLYYVTHSLPQPLICMIFMVQIPISISLPLPYSGPPHPHPSPRFLLIPTHFAMLR